jgi:hypothetical protein
MKRPSPGKKEREREFTSAHAPFSKRKRRETDLQLFQCHKLFQQQLSCLNQ